MSLLEQAGLAPARLVAPLGGGGNNRLFRVETDHAPAVLKAYFHHPDDPRDRLGAEFAFSQFAWSRGVHNIPRPLAADPSRHQALYQFVHGRRPAPHQIGHAAVAQVVEFVKRLNEHKDQADAASLPDASEACFSLAEHLERVDSRVARLDTIQDGDARGLVDEVIEPKWRAVRAAVLETAERSALSTVERLSARDRCISPSDFGFHNALLDESGRFWFLDFEYAGWDDPAKLVCDLFCQPAVPVPLEFFDSVAHQLTAEYARPSWHVQRVRLLWPLFQLKWACILLNEFLPLGSRRRRFAGKRESGLLEHQARLERSRKLGLCAADDARRLAGV